MRQPLGGANDIAVQGEDGDVAPGGRLRRGQVVNVLLGSPDERPIPSADVEDANCRPAVSDWRNEPSIVGTG